MADSAGIATKGPHKAVSCIPSDYDIVPETPVEEINAGKFNSLKEVHLFKIPEVFIIVLF